MVNTVLAQVDNLTCGGYSIIFVYMLDGCFLLNIILLKRNSFCDFRKMQLITIKFPFTDLDTNSL